jgi:hypothetical protein
VNADSSPGLDHVVALFNQFIAAGFPDHDGTPITNALSAGVTLYSPSSKETLVGGSGDDFPIGGRGDTLTGGSGHNTYMYNAKADSTPSAHDTITDFNVTNDKIDFSAISGLNSNIQPVAINLLTSTPGNIAGHTIDVVTIGGNTVVYTNTSGSSESISTHHEDMQINLTGVTSPTLSDFILHH